MAQAKQAKGDGDGGGDDGGDLFGQQPAFDIGAPAHGDRQQHPEQQGAGELGPGAAELAHQPVGGEHAAGFPPNLV